MDRVKNILNNNIFIKTIRTLGILYFVAITFNTIFFNEIHMFKTFLTFGLCGLIAIEMIMYKGTGD